jgi:hypothetical protein
VEYDVLVSANMTNSKNNIAIDIDVMKDPPISELHWGPSAEMVLHNMKPLLTAGLRYLLKELGLSCEDGLYKARKPASRSPG